MKLHELKKLTQELSLSGGDRQSLYQQLRDLGYDPANFYQELEMTYRFVQTHGDVSDSSSDLSLHSHAFYEILYCRNSCDVEYLVGAERYRLQKGDVVFVPPGVSHCPLLPPRMAEPYRRYVLWISTEFFAGMQRLFPEDNLYRPTGTRLLRTAGTRWEAVEELFAKGVRTEEEQALGWEAAVVGNTLQLIVQLRRAAMDRSAKPLKAEKPELLDQVLAYVEEHLGEKITLADAAKQFWVSQSTISQTFRAKMGTSFYRCVTQRRLIAAKSLILEGVPLEAVNERVGFSDYSTFYRAFRQEYGISPRQYRKLQESQEHL